MSRNRNKTGGLIAGDNSANIEDETSVDDLEKSSTSSSLKLVLKVGNSASKSLGAAASVGNDADISTSEKRIKRTRRKKLKDQEEPSPYQNTPVSTRSDEDDDSASHFATPKCARFDMEEDKGSIDVHSMSMIRSHREKRHVADEDKSSLQLCLEHLQKTLQRKDTNGFFAFPVTDTIAPGYSSVISHPMDFSTIDKKIEQGLYQTIADYKSDYQLMMNNCMAYNHPESVYYKEAKRLLAYGLKHMSREHLVQLRRTLPFMQGLSIDELGFEDDTSATFILTVDETANSDNNVASAKENKKVDCQSQRNLSIGRFEAIPDDMTPEEILAQAEAAASSAAGRLTLRAPNSKIGFLRRRDDGSTTLRIVNPDNDGIVSETERVVNLGSLVGRLQSGTASVLTLKEDKRNRVNPVSYLNYGAFSSYAPAYDSASANISKEDSDLLLSTYCDETGIQYAKSLRHFVRDSGDYAVSMVDSLLDLMTSGQHSKTMEILRLQDEQKERERLAAMQAETSVQQFAINANDLEDNIADTAGTNNYVPDGKIDMSFLNSVSCDSAESAAAQQQLNRTSELLADLQQTQYNRLSQKLPIHLAMVPGPSQSECEIAKNLTSQLTDLLKQVTPADVISVKQIRAAMGVDTRDFQMIDGGWQSLQHDQQANTQQNLQLDCSEYVSQNQQSVTFEASGNLSNQQLSANGTSNYELQQANGSGTLIKQLPSDKTTAVATSYISDMDRDVRNEHFVEAMDALDELLQ